MNKWIGVDFDGVLATCHLPGHLHDGSIGEPIPNVIANVRNWLSLGLEVRIVTARVGNTERVYVHGRGYVDPEVFAKEQRALIQKWCIEHLGQPLRVIAYKDFGMVMLLDDRAVAMRTDTGLFRKLSWPTGVGAFMNSIGAPQWISPVGTREKAEAS